MRSISCWIFGHKWSEQWQPIYGARRGMTVVYKEQYCEYCPAVKAKKVREVWDVKVFPNKIKARSWRGAGGD